MHVLSEVERPWDRTPFRSGEWGGGAGRIDGEVRAEGGEDSRGGVRLHAIEIIPPLARELASVSFLVHKKALLVLNW